MSNELTSPEKERQNVNVKVQGGSADAVYGIGLFGAWVYYIGRATTPQERVRGFFKGLFWPAFVVYDLLVFLHNE